MNFISLGCVPIALLVVVLVFIVVSVSVSIVIVIVIVSIASSSSLALASASPLVVSSATHDGNASGGWMIVPLTRIAAFFWKHSLSLVLRS